MKTMLKRTLTAGVIAGCSVLPFFGQAVNVGTPGSGGVFLSESGAIAAVRGFPPAAYLSGPIVAGLEYASVSPDGSRAVGVRDGRLVDIAGLPGPDVVETPLAPSVSLPVRVVWNRRSTMAAIYSEAARSIQLLRVRAHGIEAARTVDAAMLGTPVRALLVASSGEAAVVLTDAEDGFSSAYSLEPDAAPRLITKMQRATTMAYSADEDTLFIGGTSGIYAIGSYRTAAATDLILAAANGRVVTGIAVSGDRGLLFAAIRDEIAGAVAVFDLAARTVTGEFALDFSPIGFELLKDAERIIPAVPVESEPLWFLTTGLHPGVYFVPRPPVRAGDNAARMGNAQ